MVETITETVFSQQVAPLPAWIPSLNLFAVQEENERVAFSFDPSAAFIAAFDKCAEHYQTEELQDGRQLASLGLIRALIW
jgi:hypothetical protein